MTCRRSCCQHVSTRAREFYRGSHRVLTVPLCRLGPVSLATQSVLLVSASTTYQAPFALSVAASVRYVASSLVRPSRRATLTTSPSRRIGNLLGEKNAARAAVSARVAFVLALLFATVFRWDPRCYPSPFVRQADQG